MDRAALMEGQLALVERVAAGAPLGPILEDIVRLIEGQSPEMSCSIVLIDRAQGRIRAGYGRSLPDTYLQALVGAAIGPTAGSCGAAAFLGERVVVADIDTHPNWAPYKHLAMPHGLRACWSSPIFSPAKEVLGTFAMYYRTPRGPTAEELAWVDTATHLAAIAIVHEESQRRQTRLVHDLGERVKELSLLHRTARLLQGDRPLDASLLSALAEGVPPAWQHPAACEVRIVVGALEARTLGFRDGRYKLRANLDVESAAGAIEVVYREDRLAGAAPAFLPEEEQLLRSIADLLSTFVKRARAEAELRQSEERLRAVIEHTPHVAIQWYDVEGRLLFCNRASLQLYGWTLPDALGRTLGQLNFPEADAAHFLEAIRKVAATGAPHGPLEFCFVRPDGSEGVLLSTVFRIPHAAHGWCFVCMDVELTEHRRMQQTVRAAEERLQQAQKLESIGLLAGGIAHDFNNMLSVILTLSALMLEDLPDDHQMKADILEIQGAGQRAAQLTQQLLAFSRRQVLQPDVLQLSQVVAGTEKMLRRLLGEDVELRCVREGDAPPVLADPGQLEQVLINLAVNARDAMPQGGALTITTGGAVVVGEQAERLGVAPGDYATLRVADTGAGMDGATAARVFEPFFTTKERGKGTGIGLSTVFGVVKQSGGAIDLVSRPGQGTTFTIYLPRTTMKPQAARDRLAITPIDGSETILVVEDEDTVRALVRAILRKHGYQVLDAKNGVEALELAVRHEGPVHLLMTDVVMAKMSGRELAERLAVVRPETRVLFVSGYTDDEIIRRGVETSLVAFLQKPIVPERLAQKVRAVLDAPRPAA